LHIPRNNPTGICVAFCTTILGFALIWRIGWLAALGLLGVIVVALVQAWRTDQEIPVPADEVEAFERTAASRRSVA
jgi:cytochrome o ubiquinol oxidase subunit 1